MLRKLGPPIPPVWWKRNPLAPFLFVVKMSGDDFVGYAGLDAWALIEFISLALKILVYYGCYGLTVQLTVGLCASMFGEGEDIFGALAKLSVSNMRLFGLDYGIAEWDRWLQAWTSVVGGWILTILVITLLTRSWKRVVERKQRMLTDARDASSLVILVRSGYWKKQDDRRRATVSNKVAGGVAGWKKHSREEVLETWQALYGEAIFDVRMVRDTGALPKHLAKRAKLAAAIEKLEDIESNPAKSEKAVNKARTALDKKRPMLATLMEEIKKEYEAVCKPEADCGSAYFVFFTNHRDCNIAKQVLNNSDTHVEVYSAPLMTDVRWASLRPATEMMRPLFSRLALVFYYLTLMFYILPITFVSGLLKLSELTRVFPFLGPVFDAMGEGIKAALTAFLPTLSLIIFLAILPMLCNMIAGHQGFISLGEQSRDAFHRLFLFQFVWVFLGVTIGTSGMALVQNMQEIASNPLSILTTLGGQLADSAVFFMIYLSIGFCSQLPMKELARLIPIVIYALTEGAKRSAQAAKDAAIASAEAAKKGAHAGAGVLKKSHDKNAKGSSTTSAVAVDIDDKGATPKPPAAEPVIPPEPFPFAVVWAKVMLATCLGVCYAPIQPVSVLFSGTFLAFAYAFFKRGLLYSYTHASESGGSFWPVASARLLLILFVAQLMLTGVHVIKQGLPSAICIALTMPFTYFAHKSLVANYESQLSVLPLAFSAAADEDEKEIEHSKRSTIVANITADGSMSAEAAHKAVEADQREHKFEELFGGKYIQPELIEAEKLLHEASEATAQPAQRTGEAWAAPVSEASSESADEKPRRPTPWLKKQSTAYQSTYALSSDDLSSGTRKSQEGTKELAVTVMT